MNSYQSPLYVLLLYYFVVLKSSVNILSRFKMSTYYYTILPGDTWTETLAYVLFWGTASVVTGGLILFNGLEFVDAPKLVQKEKLE